VELKGIPDNKVDEIIASVKEGGATKFEKIKQSNGTFTLRAFMDALPGEPTTPPSGPIDDC